MNQPQLQSVLYYIYVFSLFSTVAHAMNMISRLWACLLYLMNVSGSGSNLANNNLYIMTRTVQKHIIEAEEAMYVIEVEEDSRSRRRYVCKYIFGSLFIP
jgi:hypothetical protein